MYSISCLILDLEFTWKSLQDLEKSFARLNSWGLSERNFPKKKFNLKKYFSFKFCFFLSFCDKSQFRTRIIKWRFPIDQFVFNSEENSYTDDTEITLGFPDYSDLSQVHQHSQACPVFAFLPVYDLRFPFFINCNWHLVTSRESINEHSPLNTLLRDKLSTLFAWAATNDKTVEDSLHKYLPLTSTLVHLSDWWKCFVDEIRAKLEPNLQSIFGSISKTNREPRLWNEKLADLLDKSDPVFEYGRIELIDSSEMKLNEKDLQFYRINVAPFSINDLIRCMAIKDTNETSGPFYEWKRTRDRDWWEKFFRCASFSLADVDLSVLRESSVFLIRPMYEEEDKKSVMSSTPKKARYHRWRTNDQTVFYYLSNDQALRSWKKSVQIVDYESPAEKKFLESLGVFSHLTTDALIELILVEHSDLSSKSVGVDNVWLDLKFIKEHYSEYSSFSKRLSLRLPIRVNQVWIFILKEY